MLILDSFISRQKTKFPTDFGLMFRSGFPVRRVWHPLDQFADDRVGTLARVRREHFECLDKFSALLRRLGDDPRLVRRSEHLTIGPANLNNPRSKVPCGSVFTACSPISLRYRDAPKEPQSSV